MMSRYFMLQIILNPDYLWGRYEKNKQRKMKIVKDKCCFFFFVTSLQHEVGIDNEIQLNL